MEHRWSLRAPIRIDIDLDCPGVGATTCTTRDIALGGVFVEMPDVLPPKNADVDLVIHLYAEGRPTQYRVKAKVVRVTRDGVGLMFRDYDMVTYRSLREVIGRKHEGHSRDHLTVH